MLLIQLQWASIREWSFNLFRYHLLLKGHPRLVQALSTLYSHLVDRKIDPFSEVLVTSGAYEALYATIQGYVIMWYFELNTKCSILFVQLGQQPCRRWRWGHYHWAIFWLLWTYGENIWWHSTLHSPSTGKLKHMMEFFFI